MPRVLVTGASGMIGRTVCRRLDNDGMQVTTAGRAASSDIAWNAGESLRHVLDGVDSVVHLAALVHVRGKGFRDRDAFEAVNTRATIRLAEEAAACGVRRFVVMSSIGVLGGTSSKPLAEDAPPAPHTAYARSKLQAEQGLRDMAGIEPVILRPPAVIGAGARGNLHSIVVALRRGLPLPFASIRNARQFVTLDNLVDAIVLALTHDRAPGETFHIANPEVLSTPQLCRDVAELAGVVPRLWSCPPVLLQTALSVLGRRSLADGLTRNLLVDTDRIRRMLGWRPRESLQEGLRKAVEKNQ